MTALTIRQLKQQIGQLTNGNTSSQIPSFWLTDWLLHVIDKPTLFLMTDDDYQLTDSEIVTVQCWCDKDAARNTACLSNRTAGVLVA